MQIHLVIPGLVWPGATAVNPVAGLELASLAWLLGLGKHHVAPFEPLDRQLARLLGYRTTPETPLPLAALRRLGEPSLPDPDPATHWLCADPVNLSFAREHLLLTAFPDGELPAEDAAVLVESLNETFADLGRFEPATPSRWYLRLNAPTRASFYPLHDVAGRPVRDFLPEGDDARLWQRTMNEVQVLLHNHPINQAREAAGLKPVNSLWFWGAGELRHDFMDTPAAVQAHHTLIRGLARAAGSALAVPEVPAALSRDTLVVLDELLAPAIHLDIDTWRARLCILERHWFAPLAEALRGRRLHTLRVTAPGDRGTLDLTVRAADTWKFWRKPLPFDALLKSLAPAAPALDATHKPL